VFSHMWEHFVTVAVASDRLIVGVRTRPRMSAVWEPPLISGGSSTVQAFVSPAEVICVSSN
jgi:hypothetical protein